MASGILGQGKPGITTDFVVYTVPSGKVAAFSVSAVSLDGNANVRVAISTSSTVLPSESEYIEYQTNLPSTGSVLERSGLMAESNRKVIVYSSTGNVSFTVYGYEETV